MEQISGSIEAIVFVHPETGFTVARLKEPHKREMTVLVGHFAAIQPGETVTCGGQWRTHPDHGRQFEVTEYTVDLPSDLVGIQKYLESGLIKGIGPAYAKKIVTRFGSETLQVIEETPERLGEIQGLGEKKIESIRECWKQQRAIREVMIFLRTVGVSPAYAQKIYTEYRDRSIERVKENPYQLAKEIHGIGFKIADQIAQKLGFPLQSPKRISAGVEFALWELSTEGHTCYPLAELVPVARQLLEVEGSLIEAELVRLVEEKRLVVQGERVWLAPMHAYEQAIAKDIHRLVQGATATRSIQTQKAAEWAETQMKIEFAPAQREAVVAALTHKIHILTGGPGTGKSTITNAILMVTEKITDKIILAAPTGRAAKRMTEITRRKAVTLHMLLEMDFQSGGFKRGRDNPLNVDFLIVDEASMIDTPLLFSLLKALPTSAKVLFVGDIDQLPSVGPGTVLRDLIQSGIMGVSRLTEIFRQARGSRIVVNAHRINQGEFPFVGEEAKSDFHFIEAETPEAIQHIILQLVSTELPQRHHFNPVDDIQVLAPMKRGIIGIEMLNEVLQERLNPSAQPLFRAGKRFHVGDKVMQISNDYDKKVFNGEVGRIHRILREDQQLVVHFDEREVTYDFSELDQLILAYAASIHKYQGSECPCVVIPIHTTHFKMLHRNLIYTGVTRGKKQVYLVGTTRALGIAINNNQIQKRHTGLEAALKGASPQLDAQLTLL